MSGICGIFHFDDKPVDVSLLRRMAEVVRYRGPDSIDYWHEGQVGMACLAFSTNPEPIHKEQFVIQRHPSFVITADARIDNRGYLTSILASVGYACEQNSSNTELILAAYMYWGEQCPNFIQGDFSFIIWDSAAKRVFAARDRMGTKPFYYHYQPHKSFLYGSECKQILQYPGMSNNLNEEMIAAELTGIIAEPGWSFFNDISQLPAAHSLAVDANGLRIQRFWEINLGDELRYRRDEEYQDHYLNLLQEVVQNRLHGIERMGIMLSGGLDSGSLASMAKKLQEKSHAPREIYAFSWLFEENAECNEREYSDQVVAAHQLIPVYIPGDAHWIYSDFLRTAIIPDDPTLLLCPPLLRAALSQAQHLGIRIMFMGSGANALLGGNWPSYLYQLRTLKIKEFFRDLRVHSQATQIAFPRLLWRYLVKPALPRSMGNFLHPSQQFSIPPWLHPDFVERTDLRNRIHKAYQFWDLKVPEQLRRFIMVTSENETRLVLAEQRLHSEYGIEERLPFRDARMLEFVTSLPPDQLWRAGEDKYLPRRAMQGLLPEQVRTSRHIGTIAPMQRLGLRYKARPLIESFLRSPLVSEAGLIDASILRTEYQRYCNGQRQEFPLNQAINLEIWLHLLSDDRRQIRCYHSPHGKISRQGTTK